MINLLKNKMVAKCSSAYPHHLVCGQSIKDRNLGDYKRDKTSNGLLQTVLLALLLWIMRQVVNVSVAVLLIRL
uniref:Uncharacterized protein n=1 Tax=Anguilla anguilla TaxID=7936 RepID=A0A0E9VI86_ANGAN